MKNKGLSLFGGLDLSVLDVAEDFTTPNATIQKPPSTQSASVEQILANNTTTTRESAWRNRISYIIEPKPQNEGARYTIFTNAGTYFERSAAFEFINLFQNIDELDEVILYLPYLCDFDSAKAMLNVVRGSACKDITVVGTFQSNIAATLLLLCGKIRLGIADRVVIGPMTSCLMGTLTDNKLNVEQMHIESIGTYQLLIDAKLLTEEERTRILDTQCSITLYGTELEKRVSDYNNVGHALIEKQWHPAETTPLEA